MKSSVSLQKPETIRCGFPVCGRNTMFPAAQPACPQRLVVYAIVWGAPSYAPAAANVSAKPGWSFSFASGTAPNAPSGAPVLPTNARSDRTVGSGSGSSAVLFIWYCVFTTIARPPAAASVTVQGRSLPPAIAVPPKSAGLHARGVTVAEEIVAADADGLAEADGTALPRP